MNFTIEEKASAKFLNIPEEIVRLLNNRGIFDDEEILDFLLKEYKLSNPFDLTDMLKSVKIIEKYVKEGKKIYICGDYDADGILGSTGLYLFLEKINANVEIDFPKREEGHGLSVERMERIIDSDCDLIISVDNGISSFEGVDFCNNKRIPVIITDHHDLGNNLPSAYSIINPKRDEFSPLCGAAVSFYLIRAIKAYMKLDISIIDYLVLASLATIADMVDLKKDNRILVNEGVNFLFETNLVGFNYLLDEIDFYSYPSSKDVSFKITPIINSAGRLNMSEKIVSLLKDTSMNSYALVKDILNINEMRKKISEECLTLANENKIEKENIIISSHEEIDIGFTGLIANKILGESSKTSVVMNNKKGSIRTKRSNAKKIIESIPYIKGGGHQGAGGFSFSDKVDLNKLKKDLEIYEAKYSQNMKESNFELDISLERIEEIKKYLYLMEPFGMGNPNPIVKTKLKYDSYKVYKKEHLIINYKGFKFKLFFAKREIPEVLKLLKDDNLVVIGELSNNLSEIEILISKYESYNY